MYERRDFNQVMIDISERLGIHGGYFKGLNDSIGIRYGGEMEAKNKLVEDGSVVHTWPDVCDRLIRDRFGDEHDLEHLKEKGVFG